MTTFTITTYTTTPSTLGSGDWLVIGRFGTIHASVSLLGAAVTGAGTNAIQVDGFVTNTADDGSGIGLQAGNNTVVIGATGFVRADARGVIIQGGDNTISCAGTIHAFGSFGIGVLGPDNTITIEATGSVLAHHGVLAGGGTTFKNFGTITATGMNGVELQGPDSAFTNAGRIDAFNNGVVVNFAGLPGSNTIVNTGTICGGEGVGITSAGSSNALFNTGTIESLLFHAYRAFGANTVINNGAILAHAQRNGLDLGAAVDTIVNNGLIQGNGSAASLGAGNDSFDGRLGVQVGLVDGGAGNDTIYGGAASDMLAGGADSDTLHGMGGFDALAGGDGVDILYGGDGTDNLMGEAGADLIEGGAGGDVIRGGLGGDLIVFNLGDNGDLIQNFNEGGTRDGFDLRGYFNATGYTGTTPRAAGIMQVLQNAADTDVYLHGAFAFRIQGVVAAAIDDTYFLFQ